MPKGLPNLPTDGFASHRGGIEIDGVEIAQFTQISGITSEVDITELKENTADGKLIIHKIPGTAKPPTITVTRAKSSSLDFWKWHEAVRNGKVGEARKNGSIVLYDFEGAEVSRYNFTGALLSKIAGGNLKAGSNEVLTEEATIVCEELMRVS